MWRAVILLCAALIIAAPPSSGSDAFKEDEHNPTEYRQEDSHPVKIFSYVIAPIGFVLKWTVAKPLHYLATESFLAPAFGGGDDYNLPQRPIARIPPDDFARSVTPPSAPEPPTSAQGAGNESPAPNYPGFGGEESAPPYGSDQPIVH